MLPMTTAKTLASLPRAAMLLAALALSPSAGADQPAAFGKPLRGLRPTALADVLAESRDGREVRLEGRVQAVCQNKGCWLELAQGTSSVHVTFEGYSFFLPKDSAGKDVVLEGKVKVRQPTPEEVEHLEHEGAGASAGSRVSVEASGVEIRAKK